MHFLAAERDDAWYTVAANVTEDAKLEDLKPHV
jgi:hypothetical protein